MTTNPIRVLLIEDDPDDVLLLKESLAEASAVRIKLTHADRLSEGLKRIAEQIFDVVLLDLNLPDSRGLDTLSNMLRQTSTTPIVVLSGLADDLTAIEAVRRGAQDYLVKGEVSGPMLARVLRYAIERKQAEAALKLFRTLVDRSNDAIEVLDPETGRFLDVNEKGCLDLGYSREEFLALSVFDIDPTVDQSVFTKGGEEFPKSGVLLWEGTHRRKDGSTFPVEVNLRYVQLDRDYIVTVVRDITERKQAEQALRKSEEAHRMVLNGIDEIVYQIRPSADNPFEGSIEFVSERTQEVLGYRPDEFIADPKRWFSLIHPEDIPTLQAKTIEIMTTGSPGIREYRIKDMTGKYRWMQDRVVPEIDEAGRVVRIFGVARDITERKKTQQALQESQKMYREVVENASDIIYSTDRNGKFAYANAAALRVVGYSLEQLRKLSYLDIILPDHRRKVQTTYFRQFLGKLPSPYVEFPFQTNSGEVRWFGQNASLVLEGQSIVGFQVIARDITERKHAEKRLATQYAAARALAESATLAEAAPRLLEAICESLDWDHAEVWSILWSANSQANTLRCTGTWHPPSLSFPEFETATRQIEFPPGVGLPGRVWASGEPAWIPDVTQDANFLRASIAAKEGLRAGFAFPIQLGGQVLGVMGFLSREIRPPDNDTLQMLTSVSSQISHFIGGKQGEEALREKERLLSEAQRIGHMGSWSYDISTDILHYSDEMYRLFDVSPEDFQHNSEGFLNLIFSLDRAEAAKWMDLIKSGRQVKEFDFRTFCKNGELRYIQGRGQPVFDSAGNPASFIGTAQDITERKLAEIQIRQQVARLSALRAIDEAITSGSNSRVVLDAVLSQVMKQLQVDAADLLILDSDEQILQFAAGQGFRTHANESARVPMGESYAGRAAKERRLVKIENLEDQPDDLLLRRFLAEEAFVCYYGVPLVAKGKVKGMLEIFHRAPLQPYPEWLDFLHTLAGQAAIAIDNSTLFENLQHSNGELSNAYDATIKGWSHAMDLRDKETEGHTQRVTEMTQRLARAMKISDAEIVHIRRGALLHDIGKMGVPDSILLKLDKLTDEEWIIMRRHPQFAFDMLSPIAYLKPALDIPHCHHEKWDGTGYPQGLKGEQIPLAARIFALADVYDAVTSDRPYRRAWSKEKALEYIRQQSGKHFDPQLVEVFLKKVAEGRLLEATLASV